MAVLSCNVYVRIYYLNFYQTLKNIRRFKNKLNYKQNVTPAKVNNVSNFFKLLDFSSVRLITLYQQGKKINKCLRLGIEFKTFGLRLDVLTTEIYHILISN